MPRHPFSAVVSAALCVGACFVPVLSPRPVFAHDWESRNAAVQTLRQRAVSLQKSGDTDGAISAYKQAVHVEPSDPDAYADLADIYFAQGKTADALRWYREATGTLPGQKWMASRMDDGDLCLRFAAVLVQMNRPDEALTMYQKGRETLPNNLRKLLPGKWQTKKLSVELTEQRAFLTACRLALGVWYTLPEAAENPQAKEKSVQAFDLAMRLSPDDPTIGLLVKNGVLPSGQTASGGSAAGAVLVSQSVRAKTE